MKHKSNTDQAELGTRMGNGVPEYWSIGGEGHRNRPVRWAKLCGKSCGFLRIFPRCFTKVRTDQGRGYAILRIVTGKALFWRLAIVDRGVRRGADLAGAGMDWSLHPMIALGGVNG